MQNVLVTGANGQLGNELKLLLQDKAAYVDRDELDITDEEAVKAYVGQGKWTLLSIAQPIRQLTKQKAMRLWLKNNAQRP